MMTTQGLSELAKRAIASAGANREGAIPRDETAGATWMELRDARLIGTLGGLTSRGVAMRILIERETEDALFGGL